MSFNESLVDGCPPPFYNARQWSDDVGSLAARVCIPEADIGGLTCCLPCPTTQWIYSDQLQTTTDGAAIVNMVSAGALGFVLLSYAALPPKYTGRHYLNIGLVISIILINLGFIVPYADHTESCANPITPNDMESSLGCALSGAFILSGALAAVMWVLIRSLAMHLQICWTHNPGRRFYWITTIIGWIIPGAVFTAAIVATGVSFRFGPNICHINHANSMADFWSWLMVMAGITVLIQTATIVYCVKIYFSNLMSDKSGPETATVPAPSIASSKRKPTAKAIYNRLKRVLWLQWRGLLIVTVMIVDVIFFLVVFLHLDASTVLSSYNIHRATPWVLCLIENPTLPQLCFQDGQEFLVTEGTLNAILILLSVVGLICFCLMVRFDFFIGWGNFIRGRDNIDTTGSAAWAEMFVEEDSDEHDEHDEKHASNVYETEVGNRGNTYEVSNEHVEHNSFVTPRESTGGLAEPCTIEVAAPARVYSRPLPVANQTDGAPRLSVDAAKRKSWRQSNAQWAAEFPATGPYQDGTNHQLHPDAARHMFQ